MILVARWQRRYPQYTILLVSHLLAVHREFHLNYPNNFLRENITEQWYQH